MDISRLQVILSFVFISTHFSICFRCSIVYGFVQRPLSGSKKLAQGVWINIARHAFVQTCLNLLWFYGLAHVGPLRAVLLSEHADIVVLAVWGAILKGNFS